MFDIVIFYNVLTDAQFLYVKLQRGRSSDFDPCPLNGQSYQLSLKTQSSRNFVSVKIHFIFHFFILK